MHRFRNVIEYKDMGKNARGQLVYQVVRLPPAMVRELGLKRTQRCRIQGTWEDENISLALNPDPESTHYLIVSKHLLKKIKKDVGDRVEVTFEVLDSNHVNVPVELQRALNRSGNKAALEVWNGLTPGKQRTWATLVDKAKLQATRTKRVKEVIARLKTGQLDPKVPLK